MQLIAFLSFVAGVMAVFTGVYVWNQGPRAFGASTPVRHRRLAKILILIGVACQAVVVMLCG